MLKLEYSSQQKLSKGNTNPKVENGALVLPKELESLVKPTGTNNADGLFALMLAYPPAFTAHCGWTVEETQEAIEKLRIQLRGHVPDDILDFDADAAPKFHLGALPPKKPGGFKP